jgi:threonine synthase
VTPAPAFVSTRDAARRPVSLEEALVRGLPPDGGLYVPTAVPRLRPGWRGVERWQDAIDAVLRPWFDASEADEAVASAQAACPFPVPIRLLPPGGAGVGGPTGAGVGGPTGAGVGHEGAHRQGAVGPGGRALLELHHGPTLAFKDIAARTMARWLGRSLQRRGASATLLVATSGDTGSAVADGFAGVRGLRVVVLYPSGRVSLVQERQLTLPREGVYALAVEGDFDDCQRLAKLALNDPALAGLGLSSANSINVGRLLPQISYHLWGALQLARALEAPLEDLWSVVPSGNLGSLAAGLLATAMGLPLAGFVAAHNRNDHFPRVLRGEADPLARPPTVVTPSNAMDVGAPSNLERLLALFPQGRYPVPVCGASVDDAATLASIERSWREDGVLVCPHTAVGLEALRLLRVQGRVPAAAPALVLATAHPAKFPEVIVRALPGVRPTEPRLEGLPPARPLARLRPEAGALRRWLLERLERGVHE